MVSVLPQSASKLFEAVRPSAPFPERMHPTSMGSMGASGGVSRRLARDVGGMPLWAIVISLLALLSIGVFASSIERSEPEPFVTPPGFEAAELPDPMPFVVFLGDSYTQGVGGDGVNWPDIIAATRGWDIANLARGGTGYLTTSDVSGCGRIYCGTYAESSEEIIGSPRVVFISGGRNDLGIPVVEIATAAGALIDDLHDRYPNAIFVLVSPWQDDDAPPRHFRDLGPALKEVATEHRAIYIETGQPLDGKPELMSEDSIHPNADGYRALAAAIDKALEGVQLP